MLRAITDVLNGTATNPVPDDVADPAAGVDMLSTLLPGIDVSDLGL